MTRSWKSREAETIWHGKASKKLPRDIQEVVRRKLRMVHNAHSLSDLRIPPSHRLEALKGDRAGQHSIRVNIQWRICFVWSGHDAEHIEIVDYH